MKTIYLLTDYKNRFNFKHDDKPYRSGMDIKLIIKYFKKYGYEVNVLQFSEIDFQKYSYKDKIFIYTSQEDSLGFYKSYIDDVLFGLHLKGANLIPQYKYFKAHNNKVFMEILLNQLSEAYNFNKLRSYYFGTLEEIISFIPKLTFPIVLKGASGANSRNVSLASNKLDLIKNVKKLSYSSSISEIFKEFVRSYKYQGYAKESKYRKKFIVQEFIPNLDNDWKIYIFHDKCFVFYRPILKSREFKASGGGYDNYFYGKEAKAPNGLLEYAYNFYKLLRVPNISIDIIYDKKNFNIIEFQTIHFGTAGVLNKYSKEYFLYNSSCFIDKKNEEVLEDLYAYGISKFIDNK